jgi:uncharacterized protein
MKKLLTIILLLLFFEINIFSQDNIKNGVYKSYYENGILKDSGNYVNGIKEGEWKIFKYSFDNKDSYGSTPAEYYNLEEMQTKVFYEIKKIQNFKNRDWSEINYFHTEYVVIQNYNEGVLNGIFLILENNNVVLVSGNYKNGNIDGEWVINHGNGSFKFLTGNFMNDEPFGYFKLVVQNNVISLNIENGKLNGECIFLQNLFLSGETRTVLQYEEGKKNGECQIFRGSKKPEEIYHFINDTLNGEYKSYFFRDFYSGVDTVLKEVGFYKNNLKTGIWKTYHETGPLSGIGEYIFGKKQGEWKTFYGYDKLNEVVYFDDGIENGRFKSYYMNGKLKSKGYYTNSKKTGTWKAYNEKGKLIETIKY